MNIIVINQNGREKTPTYCACLLDQNIAIESLPSHAKYKNNFIFIYKKKL